MTKTLAIKQQDLNKVESSGFSLAAKGIKENPKDFLKLIHTAGGWFLRAKEFGSIKNLVTVSKTGDDVLSFNDCAQNIFKLAHVFSVGLKNGFLTTIDSIVRGCLDLSWNFFKVCKILKSSNVIRFCPLLYRNISILGGLSFVASSADKAYNNAKFLFNLDPTAKLDHKDEVILCRIYNLAQNIGTFAIGTIVALGAITGATAPGVLMLIIGTIILVSKTLGYAINESYHLQIK